MNEVKLSSGALLAAVLLMISGVLNIVYGIAAIGNSSFFVHHTHYAFGSLKTWGWVTLIIAILEVLASISLFGRGTFGRYLAMVVAALMAIDSLFDIPDYPLWSLAIFGLSLWILYGLTRGWSDQDRWEQDAPISPPRESPRLPV